MCLSCKTVRRLQRCMGIAEASYSTGPEDFSLLSQLPSSSIIAAEWTSDAATLRPAYQLVVDVIQDSLVLCIRGTRDSMDALTNVTVHPEPFQDGFVHCGMLRAAKLLLAELREEMVRVLERHPSLALVVVGHSMGGGVGAILALLLRQDVCPALCAATCVAFGPPSCVSQGIARGCRDFVVGVACSLDIIPCLSMHAVRRLRERVIQATAEADQEEEEEEGNRARQSADVDQWVETSNGSNKQQKLLQVISSPLRWMRAKSSRRRNDGTSDAPAHASEDELKNPEEDLYPPGMMYILSYNETAGADGKDQMRRRKPDMSPGNFYTRKVRMNWGPQDINEIQWHVNAGDLQSFKTIRLSPWLLCDHSLSTIGEGLHALLLQYLDYHSATKVDNVEKGSCDVVDKQ
eukprot:CAMPEP_0114311160 /NCGR_PEP_ID=MMETSP0059-20121206/19664_1 /TAXON_ID=36894 /ORGANISM="Pyramimonas parkeae, Strain CCMP726" /LENGTH=404 /DNA_ID=CAMNT_0001435291 /DNA_START=303 /DNA_END=1514 /DNA_ORIENTATION=-